jgi:hypothetical protein
VCNATSILNCGSVGGGECRGARGVVRRWAGFPGKEYCRGLQSRGMTALLTRMSGTSSGVVMMVAEKPSICNAIVSQQAL